MKHLQDPEFIYKVREYEFRQNLWIQTATKLNPNKPDIVVLDRAEEICKSNEIICIHDISITKKIDEKLNNHGLLISLDLKLVLKECIRMVPIVIGALGYTPKCFEVNEYQLGFIKINTKKPLPKLRNVSAFGIVKICKSFWSFHDF